jgi:hypothetical protein
LPFFRPPNSAERLVAASTAAISASRSFLSSNTLRPASVVPPGEVTIARSSAGGFSPRRQSFAAPRRLCEMSLRAVSRASPIRTPASVKASIMRNT